MGSKSKGNSVIRMTVYSLFAVFLIAVINLQVQMGELEERKESLESQITDIRDEIAELELRLAEEMDEEYYARAAREQLGYYFPDELIFYNDFAE